MCPQSSNIGSSLLNIRSAFSGFVSLCYSGTNEATDRISDGVHHLLSPVKVDELKVSGLYAGGITWAEVLGNLLGTLGATIFSVAAAAFLIGALMYTAGFINEENKSKGKQLMIGALYGMAIVLAAKAIFNTAYFFVYGG